MSIDTLDEGTEFKSIDKYIGHVVKSGCSRIKSAFIVLIIYFEIIFYLNGKHTCTDLQININESLLFLHDFMK